MEGVQRSTSCPSRASSLKLVMLHVGAHTVILLEHLCRREDLAQDRPGAEQLYPRTAALPFAEAVHPLRIPFSTPSGIAGWGTSRS